MHDHSDNPSVLPATGRRRGPAPRGRGRPGPRRLAWAGALAGLLLVVAAAVTPPAVAAAPAAGDWPQFGRTAQHPNTNPAETAFTPGNVGGLAVAWTGQFGEADETEAGPVVAGGSVYVTGFDGNLSVFDAAGCGASACKPRWQGHTGNDITSSAAVADGLALVGSADHLLYAFPAAGCGKPVCQPRWTAQLGDAVIDSSVAVAGGVAYVGDSGGTLYAFPVKGCGAARCKPLWVGQAGAGQMLATPAVGGGRVFVGSFQATPEEFTGNLFAFPAAGCGKATCKPTWSADLGGPAERDAAPLVSGDTVFMGSSEDFGGVNGNHLFAFAAAGCGKATCKPLRTYDVGDAGSNTTPALVGDTLLASTQATPDPNTSGVVAAFPAHGCGAAVCEPLWTGVNFADGFESSPVVAGNVVFVGKGPASGFPVDAAVYAFDVRGCGKRLCQPRAFVQLSPSQSYQGSSIAVSGGKVLLNSTDNTPTPDAPAQTNLYVLALAGT